MIKITDKKLCSGCGACQQICPKGCINMQFDTEGFLYPNVTSENCINCGLCETICHEQHPFEKHAPKKTYAAINIEEEKRKYSSSGGIFINLAEAIITKGGYIFGARYDENWQVIIDGTNSIDGLKRFMGSKYLQANTGDSYKKAEHLLKEGYIVLYTGTPCQIAGLHHYLRKQYDNLYTVDVACHGVPSPKVWDKYLEETISLINSKKWKHLDFFYESDDTHCQITSSHQRNLYMRAFLSNMILRPSCYNCQAKCGRSMNDITIADFWGVQDICPKMDDDNGTSLVLIHTDKGESLFSSSKVKFEPIKYEKALAHNPHVEQNAVQHPKRSHFFLKMDKVKDIRHLIEEELRPPLSYRTIIKIKKALHLIEVNSNTDNKVTKTEFPLITSRIEKSTIDNISFRHKQHGWKNFELMIRWKKEVK